MKFAFLLVLLVLSGIASGQSVRGLVVDVNRIGVPGVTVKNQPKNIVARTGTDGEFTISAGQGDTLLFYLLGFDTLQHVVLNTEQEIILRLQEQIQEMGEVNITRKRLEGFDVGFLPPVKGAQIYSGTNAIIELKNLNGAKSTGNPREIFAKVPGLNIWESDGAGIQVGIGGRGLSPNRTENFNTRQNGYDISADALGYPESYYTPPIEALKAIEIIRGSASLQFGSQFGGLLNFIIKDAPVDTKFEFTSRNTGGTYGYFGTFNRLAGSSNRISYQVYHQYKRGDGYRHNSDFQQHQAFAQIGYYLNEKHRIQLEYTHMNYLARQAGGLTDLAFETNPKTSIRERNWFKVNWNMLALHYDWEISNKALLNFRAFGMLSDRKTLGFLGKITQEDPLGNREMLAGEFQNAGAELRFLRKYSLQKDTLRKAVRGAFLVGGRYYQGQTSAMQGYASAGNDANFTYLNPDNLEGSSFEYPSQNVAGFLENILFLGKRLSINTGLRCEYILSSSEGFYKQYVIHPINQDTIAVYTNTSATSAKRIVPLFGAGASFKISSRSSLYTNFTQNYRAINFTDIRINNPNIVIDSLIKDEFGYTAELGFRGLYRDFFIYDLAAFYIFYGDKIGLAPKAGTLLKERTNIGNAQNYGLEVFAEFDFLKAFKDSTRHSLSLFVNVSYINAVYISSKEASFVGKKVEYVSPVIAKSGLAWRFGGWSFQVQGAYNAAQFSDATNALEPSGDAVIGLIPSYFVFDFSSRYRFKRYFTLELGVNNFTNQSYFTRRASGYPGPGILPSDGISGYLTVQYVFRTKR